MPPPFRMSLETGHPLRMGGRESRAASDLDPVIQSQPCLLDPPRGTPRDLGGLLLGEVEHDRGCAFLSEPRETTRLGLLSR